MMVPQLAPFHSEMLRFKVESTSLEYNILRVKVCYMLLRRLMSGATAV